MDNCNYDKSFNFWISLSKSGDLIIDDEKGHPDLLVK